MSRGRAQDNTGARPDLGAELLHASGRGDAAAVPGEDMYPISVNLTFQGTDDLKQARFYVAADDVPELQESFLIGLQAQSA